RTQLDEPVAEGLRFTRDSVAHLYANAIDPLPKRLRATAREDAFHLERLRSRDVVTRQPFGGPVRREQSCIVFERDGFPLEPCVGRLGDLVNPADRIGGVVQRRGRAIAPRQESPEPITQPRPGSTDVKVGWGYFGVRSERCLELDFPRRAARARSTKC